MSLSVKEWERRARVSQERAERQRTGVDELPWWRGAPWWSYFIATALIVTALWIAAVALLGPATFVPIVLLVAVAVVVLNIRRKP